ncbi:hypothetical protein ACGFOU_18870 [Streptomyces sp. NPDC048595]|uniref:hypothetical protein n=1 Tax=Streptomyces sp. NPDC048595 TaxID=3365576 RepID=UPI003710179C
MSDNSYPLRDEGAPLPWDDRHLVVNDPVRAERQLQRFEFIRRRPPVLADRSMVFLAADGRCVVYPPQQQPTRGELVNRDLRMLYEVQAGIQHMSLEHFVPAQGDAFFFRAETDVRWEVIRPARVVECQLRDVRALLDPPLQELLRSVTRAFRIEQSAQAENAVRKALAGAVFGEEEGLEIRCTVRLSLDETAREQLVALRRLDYEKDTTRSAYELELQRTQQDQRLIEERTRGYRDMLAQGDVTQWAMQLAGNPSDLPLVLAGIRDDSREANRNQLELIKHVLASSPPEDHMQEQLLKKAVEQLESQLGDAAQGKLRRHAIGHESPEAFGDVDEGPGQRELE